MSQQHNYEVHPAATLFPMMDDAAFADLKADIKANGQQDDILLWHDGTILDGRNRLKACLELGVEPSIGQFDYDSLTDPFAYVLSKNLHRRHLTTSQRATIAAKLSNMTRGGDRKSDEIKVSKDTLIDIEAAAASLNVSPISVKRAKKLMAEATPEAISRIEQGKSTVGKELNVIQKAKQLTQPKHDERTVRQKPETVSAKLKAIYKLCDELTDAEAVQVADYLDRRFHVN